MADVYGRNLDSLMQNKIGLENAEANKQASYRQFLNQIANTGVASRDVDNMDRYRMGELGVRQYQAETGRMDVNNMADYRKGELGARNAENESMTAYRQGLVKNAGDTTAANERIAGLQAQTATSNLDKQIEANKYLAQFRVFNPTDLESAQAGLYNAQADNLRKGGFGSLSNDQKTLAMTDIAGRRATASQLPILQSNLDAETARILGGKGSLWGGNDEYMAVKKAAEGLPGGATEANIQKVARQKAAAFVIGSAKNYNVDPSHLSLDGAGNLIVPESPYSSLLKDKVNTPGGQPAPAADPGPAPGLTAPTPAPAGATPNRVLNPRGGGIPAQQPAPAPAPAAQPFIVPAPPGSPNPMDSIPAEDRQRLWQSAMRGDYSGIDRANAARNAAAVSAYNQLLNNANGNIDLTFLNAGKQ